MDINSHILNSKANNDMKHADAITGDQFEYFMTHVLNHMYFHNVVHTRLVNDHGLDAYGYDDKGQRIGFQFKNYSHKVPYKAVYETLGGATYYKTPRNYLITNNYFTRNTYSTVRTMNENSSYLIILVNRTKLLSFFRLSEKLQIVHRIKQTKQYKIHKKQVEKRQIRKQKEQPWITTLSNKLDEIKHQSNSIGSNFTTTLSNNVNNINHRLNSVMAKIAIIFDDNISKITHCCILGENIGEINHHLIPKMINLISIFGDSVDSINRYAMSIRTSLGIILKYQLSSLKAKLRYVRHLQHVIPLYVANNELEHNIDKSKSTYNFHSYIKQFAYYTLSVLPKYHVTLKYLIKRINNGIKNSILLKDDCLHYALLVNIAYPVAINQTHNYTKQHLIFVYYSPEYIKWVYPNYPTKNSYLYADLIEDLGLSNNLNQHDIITIVSNSAMTGHKKPIDSNANLYNYNQFSVDTNIFNMAHTLVNFDDINTLSNSLKLYHNPDGKQEIQSNMDYLNTFYSNRKRLLSKIKAVNEAHEQARKHKALIHKLQIHKTISKNSKKYHQLNDIIETDIDNSKIIHDFYSRPKQFAYCTLLLSTHDADKYIDYINKANVKKAYNWDATNSTKFGNQRNKSYYYLVLNIKHDRNHIKEYKRILFIYYSPKMMRTEYKNSFPYQNLYRKALNESVYHENLIGSLNVSFSINEYVIISNLVFNPLHSEAVVKSDNGISQYQVQYGDMPATISDIKSLSQAHNVYNKKEEQIEAEVKSRATHAKKQTKVRKEHEVKVRNINTKRQAKIEKAHETKIKDINVKRHIEAQKEIIKNSKKYRQLNSIIEQNIDKSKSIHDFSSRTKQFAFCTLMQSIIYRPYTNNLIKAISKATVKQATNQDDGHDNNANLPFGQQKGKPYNYLELHVCSPIYNGLYNDNLCFIYYALDEYKYGYPYQDIFSFDNGSVNDYQYYDDDSNDDFNTYDEYSHTIISNFVFNQQHPKSKRINIGFQGDGQVIQYHSNKLFVKGTYVDDIKTLVQSYNAHNNYYTKFKERMSSHNQYLMNERKQPIFFGKNADTSKPLLMDKFNVEQYYADKHREQVNHKDFEDKLQHLNPHDRQMVLDQIRSERRTREKEQQMYERAQQIREGIHTLSQQGIKQSIKLGKKGAKWLKNFANQHMQTRPYTNTGYENVPSYSFKVCPVCHSKVKADCRFCMYCGHNFDNEYKSNISSNVSKPSDSFKICPVCHTKVGKSSHFCIHCGYHFID